MEFTKKDTAAVKGIAIVMMMFHHCFLGAERYSGYDISFPLLGETRTVMLASFCKICVAIFVFLSGYGITVSLSRLDESKPDAMKKQIGKRYISMMSGFYFIYVISIIVVAIIDRGMFSVYAGKGLADKIWYAFVDFLGLANLFDTPTLNGTWWYMSLAIIIIVAMPILFKVYKKFGTIAVLVVSACVCCLYNMKNFDMVRWIFTLVLGMIFADKNLLAKIREIKFVKKFPVIDYGIKFIVMTALLIACVYVRQNVAWEVPFLRDGIIPVYVVIYVYVLIIRIPILNKVLQFLGKYSMNIFLFHTFLRAYFLKDFLYSLKYPALIVTVLLAISLACAIIIDLLKKFCGYDKLVNKIKSAIA